MRTRGAWNERALSLSLRRSAEPSMCTQRQARARPYTGYTQRWRRCETQIWTRSTRDVCIAGQQMQRRRGLMKMCIAFEANAVLQGCIRKFLHHNEAAALAMPME